MKRPVLFSVICALLIVAGTSMAEARVPRMKMPALTTEKVVRETFKIDNDQPEGIIGMLKGYSVEWPADMGGLDLTNMRNAVGRLAFGENYVEGTDAETMMSNILYGNPNAAPTPYEINEAFFNSTDFQWLNKPGMQNFYYDLTLVKILDKRDGKYVSYRKSYTGWMGATAHESFYYMIYDIAGNKRLNFEDIFLKGSEDAILKEIIAQMMKDCGAKTYAELKEMMCFMFEGDYPPVTHNVAFVDGKFVFTYNPYEIACGSVDHITVNIPAKRLRPYLTSIAGLLFLK